MVVNLINLWLRHSESHKNYGSVIN